eukprot:TRINITY_DN15822_c0_g1_i3.p1 TRINITY_DN15822_c0_g1~~TRINITY_DN15822_c0_g1_i3.p1  ORF type:complete len:162 (+),score=27.60 TRINITY_DN15822_c0_g1_i3:252-737(+)
MSLVGYLSYCGDTEANILDSMSVLTEGWQRALVFAIRVANVLKLAFALPLRFNVARSVFLERRHGNSRLLHVGLTTLLVSAAVGIAACPLRLSNVIGVTSAVCASFIIYIFPAALCISLSQRRPSKHRRGGEPVAYCVGAFGLCLLLSGTYTNLQRMLQGN